MSVLVETDLLEPNSQPELENMLRDMLFFDYSNVWRASDNAIR